MPDDHYLQRDHVYLFERYFNFLTDKNEQGLIILDEKEEKADKCFVKRMRNYFMRTETGRYRSTRVVPTPFFVASDIHYPVQAADMVIYCINWGFRILKQGMNSEIREDIAVESVGWIGRLQSRVGKQNEGNRYIEYGVKFVDNPYCGANNKQ